MLFAARPPNAASDGGIVISYVDILERAAGLKHDGGLSREEAEVTTTVREYVDAQHRVGLQIDGLLGELASADRLRQDRRVEPLLRALGLQSVRAPGLCLGHP